MPSPSPPPRVKTVQLPDAPGMPPPSAQTSGRRRPYFAVTSRTSWLIPPAFLAAALLGVAIVLSGPVELYGIALAVMFGIGVLWALISVFFPGRADLGCPRCKAEALERLSPDEVTGIRCTSCGFEDPDASSWMLAEQEGVSLEGIVMENRGRGPRVTEDSKDQPAQ